VAMRLVHHRPLASQLEAVAALRGGNLVERSALAVYTARLVSVLMGLGGVALVSLVLHVLYLVARGPVLSESGMRSRRWDMLKDELRLGGVVDKVVGSHAASSHATGAREEAARKLIMNHARVLHDITRPDGQPKTQQSLARLPGQECEVDAALHQVACRLLGTSKGKPGTPEEASAWAATAEYLIARIQSSTAEMANTPGHEERAPDMSAEAAAAMRAVLAEVGAEDAAAQSSIMELLRGYNLRPAARGAADAATERPATVGP